MALLRRFKGALNKDRNGNERTVKGGGGGECDGTGAGAGLPPLAGFLADIPAPVDSGPPPQQAWRAGQAQKSRLSKTTKEILHDHSALAYFIQYLEARDAVQLVKFWLEVESFKSSSTSAVTPGSLVAGRQVGKAELIETEAVAETSISVEQPDRKASKAGQLAATRTEDAVKIYRRYIAPDCSRPLHLPTEYKRDIVELICAESGCVASDCFTAAQNKVVEVLEMEYFPDFLKSEYHAKHQVDVLTGGAVLLPDILYNDTALSHFMEYTESQQRRLVIEFWLAGSNFQQSTGAGQTESSQEDAMVLYEKYISMQASAPLGFPDEVRLEVENKICSEGGPDRTCFDRPLEIVMSYMEKNLISGFLESTMYKNYVKELIGTITASPRSLATVHSGSLASSSSGAGWSRDSCSEAGHGARDSCSDTRSDCSSEPGRESGRSHNTLLAGSGSQPALLPQLRLDQDQDGDPDQLWRRVPVREKVGRINSIGRYEPGWDLAPDMTRLDGTKQSSRLSKAVKKLVSNEEHERMKEEMAWQVAEMIVKDVTSVTMGAENAERRHPSRSGLASTSLNNNLQLSHSLTEEMLDCDLLSLDSDEIPSANYF